MTLTSEMTRLTASFEAARADRLTALDGIRAGMQRLLADARTSRRRVMADHAKAIEAELKGLLSEPAIIRGRAEDLIEQFATRREREAATLRARLEAQVADLQLSVEEMLVACFRNREEMRARELAGRRAYRQALRADVGKTLTDLAEDREGAARIWRKHARAAAKSPPAAAKAAKKASPQKASDDKPAPAPAPAAKGGGVDTEDKKKGPKDKSQG